MSPDRQPELLVPHDAIDGGMVDARRVVATLLGADYSARSITPQRADRAPGVVRAAMPRLARWDAASGRDLTDACIADLGDVGAVRCSSWDDAFTTIRDLARRAHRGGLPVIGLGGDHSVLWPLATAAREALAERVGPDARLGIVQLDVHHDVRDPDATGPSNGTPVRGLVESATVQGCDVVQIGIHPFGNARELGEWCDERGVHRVLLHELRARGVAAVVAEALEQLGGCHGLYLTVDIDVLDRSFAPGTVAALPGGLAPAELASLVAGIWADPRMMAMDVVEFDPERDVAGITALNAAHVISTTMSALLARP